MLHLSEIVERAWGQRLLSRMVKKSSRFKRFGIPIVFLYSQKFGAYGLCQQLGTDDYLRVRDLRRTILRWLDVIQAFWTECPASLGNDGRSLQLRPARPIHSAVRSES